jgi:hypothetical protein
MCLRRDREVPSSRVCIVKKTAVLIDAGFLRTFLPTTVGFKVLADIVEGFAVNCVSAAAGEEMHRILYYDCKPYGGSGANKPHPIDGPKPPVSPSRQNFFNSTLTILKSKPYFAVRLGEMSFDGWALSHDATRAMLQQRRPPASADFIPVLRQKGVDLRIGTRCSVDGEGSPHRSHRGRLRRCRHRSSDESRPA